MLFALFLSISVLMFFIFSVLKKRKLNQQLSTQLPRWHPIIGSFFFIRANKDRRVQWASDILLNSPSATHVFPANLGRSQILTGNPANVQHILKTNFHLYEKGDEFRQTLYDFLGDGISNVNGDIWKFHRQVLSHEFNTNSLQKFVETVVVTELSERLIPILSSTAANKQVLDFQNILQRFSFDNICKVAFGYDPAYLLPSLPHAKFAKAFDEGIKLSSDRFFSFSPVFWKVKRLLGIGLEKRLKQAVIEVRDFAKSIVKEKKEELRNKSFRTCSRSKFEVKVLPSAKDLSSSSRN